MSASLSPSFSPTPSSSATRARRPKGDTDVVKWLPDMDLNHDKQIQSLLCYRYTIGQNDGSKLQSLK